MNNIECFLRKNIMLFIKCFYRKQKPSIETSFLENYKIKFVNARNVSGNKENILKDIKRIYSGKEKFWQEAGLFGIFKERFWKH